MAMKAREVYLYVASEQRQVAQGPCGLAFLGDKDVGAYTLLLYKSQTQHLARVPFTSAFKVEGTINGLYCTLYDTSGHTWTILFQTEEEVRQYALATVMAKYGAMAVSPGTSASASVSRCRSAAFGCRSAQRGVSPRLWNAGAGADRAGAGYDRCASALRGDPSAAGVSPHPLTVPPACPTDTVVGSGSEMSVDDGDQVGLWYTGWLRAVADPLHATQKFDGNVGGGPSGLRTQCLIAPRHTVW